MQWEDCLFRLTPRIAQIWEMLRLLNSMEILLCGVSGWATMTSNQQQQRQQRHIRADNMISLEFATQLSIEGEERA